MNIKSIKRIAARILEVGENKVLLNPSRLDEIKEAITNQDIITLVKDKAISARTAIEEIKEEIENGLISENKKEHILEQNWHHIKPVFAVCSGGLYPALVPKLVKMLGKNIIIQMGGGIHGHPSGTLAGAKAARQAIDAVMQKKSLNEYAKKHLELKEALRHWK